MKKYKEKKTGEIWEAIDRQHIKYFESSPNFTEVKEVEDKKQKDNHKKIKQEAEVSSTIDTSNGENK